MQSGRGTLETVFGVARRRARRLRRRPDVHDPPLGTRRRRAAARPRDRGRPATSASPRYLTTSGQFNEFAPYCERDLRGADRAAARRRRRRRRPRAPRGGLTRYTYAPPPLRRRRLGRLPVPVRAQHPRLRADRRRAPPAAARPPDVRGAELRRVLLRAPAATTSTPTPSRCRTTTPTSTPTRCFLLGRRLHEPRRVRHRRRVDLAPPGRVRARSAARHRSRACIGRGRTEEVAVMVDTFRPLGVTDVGAEDQRRGLP